MSSYQVDAQGNVWLGGRVVAAAGTPQAAMLLNPQGWPQGPLTQPGAALAQGIPAPQLPQNNPMPAMNPTQWSDIERAAARGFVGFRPIDCSIPQPPFPISDQLQLRTQAFPLTITGVAANSESVNNLALPEVGYVTSLRAVVINTNTGAEVGNHAFLVDLQRNNGDKFTSQAVNGSTLFGTAQRPGFIAPMGWRLDRGEILSVTVTPLQANLAIYLTFVYTQVFGPANFAWPGSNSSPAVEGG